MVIETGDALVSIPIWMLLGFATWTVLLLISTVGVYRWARIFFRGAPLSSFRSDRLEGEDWYQRGMRAHANCIESLPVFAAIVLVLSSMGLNGPWIDYLCTIVLIARVCQSLVHVSHVQTDAFVAVRFSFFAVQLSCFLVLIGIAVSHG